jgi:effector-binding domain-containing protein
MNRQGFPVVRIAIATLMLAVLSVEVRAQSTSPSPAIEAAPLGAPSPDSPKPVPAPDAPPAPSLPQGSLPSATPPTDTPVPMLQSLAPPVSEVTLPDTIEFQPKPAVIVHGKAQWETAYDELRSAFDRGREAAKKAGLTVVGYPVTVFVETNDVSFTYDALLPVSGDLAAQTPDLGSDIRLGSTPSGKAIRFAHLASYDEIDGAYEQITAYLDAKDIVVKDAFIEEYLVFGDNAASPATTINIFVQPKK